MESTIHIKDKYFTELLIQKSRFFEIKENFVLSIDYSAQAVELAQSVNDPLLMARSQCQFAFTNYLADDLSINKAENNRETVLAKRDEFAKKFFGIQKILEPLLQQPEPELLVFKTNDLFLDYRGILALLYSNFFEAEEFFKQSFSFANKIDYDYISSASLHNLSFVYIKLGKFELALELIDKDITVLKRLGNQFEFALSLNAKSEILREMGYLEQSLTHKKQVLDIGEQLNRFRLKRIGVDGIARIYLEMGEFEKSKSYFNQYLSILKEQYGTNEVPLYPNIKMALGVIARYEMNYSLSLQYLNEALDTLLGESFKPVYLFELITTYLESNTNEKLDMAKLSLNEIDTINQSFPDIQENLDLFKLGKAMILNNSPRLEHKFQAKELLIDLENNALKPRIKLLASQTLIEILLYELKGSQDDLILDDLKEQIDKVFAFSNAQKRFSFMIETYFLQSRVAVIEGHYQQAFELLSEAENICTEKKMSSYAKRIDFEKKSLTEYINVFNDNLKSNRSIVNKIEVVNFSDYFTNAKKLLNSSIDEKSSSNRDIFN